jgi:hypothetical protein
MNEVEIPLKITGIGAIKAELRELKGQIADATDPEVMTALAQRAGELKDRLKDANEQIAVFTTGSKFEAVSTSFGQIGSDLASLDFEGASEKASVFAKNLGNLNPGDLTKGFKSFTSMITTVGGAFVKLGATILMNPIFLLVAVITAIVVAIGFFLKKIGVLDAILEAIMIPINAVIQGFKDLTDWMGLTDNAAEENAEAVKEASEKNRESLKAESQARQELYNLTKDLSDEEIAAIEEKLGIQIDTSQSIFDLKREQIEGDMAINQAEIDSLNLKKELTEEDKKRLADLTKTQADLANQQVQNEINKINAISNLNVSLDKQIELLQAKQIKGESERAKAMLDIQQKEALAKVEQQIKEAQQLGDSTALAKAQQLKNLIIQDFKIQELEITNKGNAAVSKANVTSVGNTNKEVKNKYSEALADLRKKNEVALQEAENAGKSEQELRDLRITQLEAERKYLFDNLAKIYKKEVDQKAALAKIDNDLKKARDKTAADKEKAENEELISRLKRKEVNAKDDIAKFEAQKELLEAEAKIKMDSLEVGSEERGLLEDETAKKLKEIDDQITAKKIENQQKILAAAQLTAETKLSKEAFELERFKGTKDEEIAANEAFLKTTLATLKTQKETELAALNLSEEEKAAIEEKFRQAKEVAEEATAAKLVEIDQAARDKLNANIEAGFQLATTAAGAIASIQDINTKKKLKGIEKGSKEEEKILKQQFEQQKKMQLAMAVINGAQAIVSILAQYPKFDGGFAMAAAIAGSVISTATSLATIASTSFEGGGTAPTTDANSFTGGGSTTGSMATPAVSLFGQGNQLNNVGGEGPQQGQTITVNAIVSETEMTDTQNKINKIQKNAEL